MILAELLHPFASRFSRVQVPRQFYGELKYSWQSHLYSVEEDTQHGLRLTGVTTYTMSPENETGSGETRSWAGMRANVLMGMYHSRATRQIPLNGRDRTRKMIKT